MKFCQSEGNTAATLQCPLSKCELCFLFFFSCPTLTLLRTLPQNLLGLGGNNSLRITWNEKCYQTKHYNT